MAGALLPFSAVSSMSQIILCYTNWCRVSAALRRIPLVRWHAYMDECIEILETSPDALPSDKALIRWVKLTQIMEEVCCHFVTDEPDLGTTSEPKIHYALKVFERQLEQWRKETPAEHYSCEYLSSKPLWNMLTVK